MIRKTLEKSTLRSDMGDISPVVEVTHLNHWCIVTITS